MFFYGNKLIFEHIDLQSNVEIRVRRYQSFIKRSYVVYAYIGSDDSPEKLYYRHWFGNNKKSALACATEIANYPEFMIMKHHDQKIVWDNNI